MTRKDYERAFDQLAADNLLVRAALAVHERDRSNVDLVLAMKIAVVELARDNARLLALAEQAVQARPALIRLCDHDETCSSESKTLTSSES